MNRTTEILPSNTLPAFRCTSRKQLAVKMSSPCPFFFNRGRNVRCTPPYAHNYTQHIATLLYIYACIYLSYVYPIPLLYIYHRPVTILIYNNIIYIILYHLFSVHITFYSRLPCIIISNCIYAKCHSTCYCLYPYDVDPSYTYHYNIIY